MHGPSEAPRQEGLKRGDGSEGREEKRRSGREVTRRERVVSERPLMARGRIVPAGRPVVVGRIVPDPSFRSFALSCPRSVRFSCRFASSETSGARAWRLGAPQLSFCRPHLCPPVSFPRSLPSLSSPYAPFSPSSPPPLATPHAPLSSISGRLLSFFLSFRPLAALFRGPACSLVPASSRFWRRHFAVPFPCSLCGPSGGRRAAPGAGGGGPLHTRNEPLLSLDVFCSSCPFPPRRPGALFPPSLADQVPFALFPLPDSSRFCHHTHTHTRTCPLFARSSRAPPLRLSSFPRFGPFASTPFGAFFSARHDLSGPRPVILLHSTPRGGGGAPAG